jgi:hypothetical protein
VLNEGCSRIARMRGMILQHQLPLAVGVMRGETEDRRQLHLRDKCTSRKSPQVIARH